MMTLHHPLLVFYSSLHLRSMSITWFSSKVGKGFPERYDRIQILTKLLRKCNVYAVAYEWLDCKICAKDLGLYWVCYIRHQSNSTVFCCFSNPLPRSLRYGAYPRSFLNVWTTKDVGLWCHQISESILATFDLRMPHVLWRFCGICIKYLMWARNSRETTIYSYKGCHF